MPTRIAIFDDSTDALRRYAEVFADTDCELLTLKSSVVTPDIRDGLVALQPNLIIVDLVMGESRSDGYRLIRQIQGVPFKNGLPPIVVCSKLITESTMGQAERAQALNEPGVKAAFGKFPDLPRAVEFLKVATRSGAEGDAP